MRAGGDAASATLKNSGSGFVLSDKDAVLVSGAEIDVDALDLVAFESEELGIAEALPVRGDAGVGHEGLVAFDEYPVEIATLEPVTVAPAPLEIGGLVDGVVIGAGETKVVRQRVFDRAAVVR